MPWRSQVAVGPQTHVYTHTQRMRERDREIEREKERERERERTREGERERETDREDLFNRLANTDRWSYTSKRAARLGKWAISDPRRVCVCALMHV